MFSDFSSQQTIGITGDAIMYHILMLLSYTTCLKFHFSADDRDSWHQHGMPRTGN